MREPCLNDFFPLCSELRFVALADAEGPVSFSELGCLLSLQMIQCRAPDAVFDLSVSDHGRRR